VCVCVCFVCALCVLCVCFVCVCVCALCVLCASLSVCDLVRVGWVIPRDRRQAKSSSGVGRA
jgi:hypothetical protein